MSKTFLQGREQVTNRLERLPGGTTGIQRELQGKITDNFIFCFIPEFVNYKKLITKDMFMELKKHVNERFEF